MTFDLEREPTFRHEADDDYKATRHAMPEELADADAGAEGGAATRWTSRAMSWRAGRPTTSSARSAAGCEAAGWDCVIVTGDKDSLQLVTEHTKVKLVSTRMGQTTTKDMTPGDLPASSMASTRST